MIVQARSVLLFNVLNNFYHYLTFGIGIRRPLELQCWFENIVGPCCRNHLLPGTSLIDCRSGMDLYVSIERSWKVKLQSILCSGLVQDERYARPSVESLRYFYIPRKITHESFRFACTVYGSNNILRRTYGSNDASRCLPQSDG